MKLRISLQCTQCGACAAICPDGAILRAKKRIRIEPARCRSCGGLEAPVCEMHCPAGAIRVIEEEGRKKTERK